MNSSEPPTNLLHPICAGAALRFYKPCPRCGASVHEYCRDDAAYQTQADERKADRLIKVWVWMGDACNA